mgnify:CR=1 FL=1
MLKLEEYKKLEENMDEYLNLYCKGIVNKLHVIANCKVNNINYEYELWELERYCTAIDVLYNISINVKENNDLYIRLHDYIRNNVTPNTLRIALHVIKENKRNMLNADIWLLGLTL